MNNSSLIRPIAICLFRRDAKILLAKYHDTVKPETFYRPLGGGIEFGEYAAAALARELREELNAEICDVRYLFTLENIFTHNGKPGHEIVLVFDGAFVNQALYAQPVLHGRDTHAEFEAVWKAVRELQQESSLPDSLPLYPSGLLERLSKL